MPLTARHWWIASVASLGQLVGTAVATIAGVIIPMLLICDRNGMSSVLQGLIGAADLIGIMVGSLFFGKLSDRYGYLLFFRLCPVIIVVFSLLAVVFPHVAILVVSLFMVGFGIGGEYSLDSDYTSELMPDRWKVFMLGMVKTGAAFGNIIAAGLCFLFVMAWKDAAKWPDLMLIIAGIGALMFASRIYFFESPKWLLDHGHAEKANIALHRFLGNDVNYPADMAGADAAQAKAEAARSKMSTGNFIRSYFDRVVFSGIPWACEGLGVYGIGVFIPILVMTLGIEHESASTPQILHVAQSVKTTLWISCIILPGFLTGIFLTCRRIRIVGLQASCFWACGGALLLLLFSYMLKWPVWISLISFMAFELFLNIGPHLVTYLLPPRIYPVAVRGQGTGIAAAIGKAGATAGVFLVPWLLEVGGGVLVLGVSAAIMGAGALVTSIYGRRVDRNQQFSPPAPAATQDALTPPTVKQSESKS